MTTQHWEYAVKMKAERDALAAELRLETMRKDEARRDVVAACERNRALEAALSKEKAGHLYATECHAYATRQVLQFQALAEWCKPDEHSPPEHWTAWRVCFESTQSAPAPPSELCAVCDQIKELHSSTHPWTSGVSAASRATALETKDAKFSPGPITQEPQDYRVQCRCGWMGQVSTLKSLPDFKMGCPDCSQEFVPIGRMTFPVTGSEPA